MRSIFRNRLNALRTQQRRPKQKPGPKLVPTLPQEIRDAAKLGWKLFPCRPVTKKPAIKNNLNAATDDTAKLEAWAAQFPECNWALATGERSDVDVIDVDRRHNGHLAQRAWEAQRLTFPPTRTTETADGTHWYFKHTPGVRSSTGASTKGLAPGVDIRGDGGYVMMPPSIHPDTHKPYKIGELRPVAEAPQWLQDKLLGKGAGQKKFKDTIPEGERHNMLVSTAGTLRRHGATPEQIEVELDKVNREKCPVSLPPEEIKSIAQSMKKYPVPANVQAELNDPRPKVELPGDDREVNTFADELGRFFARKTFFLSNNVVVTIEDKKAARVSAQKFRTLAAEEVVCYKKKTSLRNFASFEVTLTMTEDNAAATLASNNWRQCMRPLQRISFCRQPALRSDGELILVPEGYHSASETWTDSDVEYDEDMPFDEAVKLIRGVFSEFVFSDGELGRSMAIAGLLGFYARAILPEGSTRPVFITDKNRPGAGATTLTRCMVLPVLGFLPTGVKPANEDELRKTLTTAVLEQSAVVFLDNVKGRIDSASLEAFTSSANWNDRLLGANESVSGPVRATVFVTANGATSSEDFRRRCLRIRLHIRQERPEDRRFSHDLSDAGLLELRPKILAACWSIVKAWDAKGRPKCSRGNSSFTKWTEIVGGMVEAAGFACPIPTASEEERGGALDEDREAMRELALSMTLKKRYSIAEITALCREKEVFINLVENFSDAAKRSAFGWVLKKANDTDIGDRTFYVGGNRHIRVFWVEKCLSDDVQVGEVGEVGEVSKPKGKKHVFTSLGRKPSRPSRPPRPAQPKKYARKAGQR